MAKNFIQEGKKIYTATATGLLAGAPFVTGSFQPCALLTNAGSSSPYEATVQTEGVFELSVKGHNGSGNTAIAIGDAVYWNASDTPTLTANSNRTFFGIALEAVNSGSTSTIKVRLQQGVQGIGADQVKQSHLNRRYTFEEFDVNPVTAKVAGGAASGTATHTNVMATSDNVFEYNIKGTQTITAPSLAATGLDVAMDNTDNDGVEITQGITAKSRAAFKVGTSGAFYAKCKFSLADVSGTDDCAFGFRKAEAYQANIDDYDEMACLNVISGDIKIETILNNGETTTTDTTDNWADAATHTLEVYVSAAGVVTYKIDGAAPTVTAAFTFDNNEVVVPFFFFLHASDVCDTAILQEWEVGLQ